MPQLLLDNRAVPLSVPPAMLDASAAGPEAACAACLEALPPLPPPCQLSRVNRQRGKRGAGSLGQRHLLRSYQRGGLQVGRRIVSGAPDAATSVPVCGSWKRQHPAALPVLTVCLTALASWFCTALAAALCRNEALVASRRCSSEPMPAASLFWLAAAAAVAAGVPALRFFSLAAASLITAGLR